MNCCQCQGIEACFDQNAADKELAAYRKKGATRTTRFLLESLKQAGIEGLTLLDIGGGVGAIQHDLLRAGAKQATHVDASSAYLRVSQTAALEQGHADRVTYRHGNFVDLAPALSPADIVTLDRVICCYHDMPALVQNSVALARAWYAVVYPRDIWWTKPAVRVVNLFLRLRGTSFRVFIHPTRAVEDIIHSGGFTRQFYRRFLFWQAAVYRRSG